MKNVLQVFTLILLLSASMATAQLGSRTSGYIFTVAGDGYKNGVDGGFSGDGGPATNAELSNPSEVTVDGTGNIYIVDTSNARIRKVAAATGIITTFAGVGVSGFSGDGGPAIDAEIGGSDGIVADAAGNIYFSDVQNRLIRKVDAATGIISTYVDSAALKYNGSGGGPAGTATPLGVAMDVSGNLYFAQTYLYAIDAQRFSTDGLIRKVDAATGIITTVAGNGTFGTGGDGGPATSAEIGQPYQVAVDAAGNLYFTDISYPSVRKVDAATGIITTVAGNGTFGSTGGGQPATNAEFDEPYGLAVDAAGDMYISDADHGQVWRVDAITGIIEPYAGGGVFGSVVNGGPALGSALNPWGLSLDGKGNLYLANMYYQLIQVVGSEANEPTTTTTLTVSAIELNYGQPLTLTATVTAESGGIPTGIVSFLNGTTVLGAAVMNDSGVATLTLTLAGGSYPLIAVYSGSPKDQGSVSYPPIEVTVNPASTTTVLTASPNPAYWGNTVTFSATVGNSIVTPRGSVSFYDGDTLLATEPLTSGVATYSTMTLSLGSHNITAAFVANANFNVSTSNTVVEVIAPADFSISASPGSQSVYTGEAATYAVTITPGTGWTLPVALSCTQLPANSSCTFSPATVNGGTWSSTLVVQTTPPSPASSASFLSAKLRVTTLAGLFLLILPRRRRRDRTGWPMLLLIFTVLACGAAVTGCGTPGPLAGATPVGDQTIMVTGTATNGSQTLTHTANATLNVKSLF